MMFHHTDPFAATAGFIRTSSSTVWRMNPSGVCSNPYGQLSPSAHTTLRSFSYTRIPQYGDEVTTH
ncbi:hypothetical protein BH24ACT24_BH24ACT24_04530 [soil metagenome]